MDVGQLRTNGRVFRTGKVDASDDRLVFGLRPDYLSAVLLGPRRGIRKRMDRQVDVLNETFAGNVLEVHPPFHEPGSQADCGSTANEKRS